MKLLDKLDVAIDRAMVALDEAIRILRTAHGILEQLQPTLAQLPALTRSVGDLVAAQRAAVAPPKQRLDAG